MFFLQPSTITASHKQIQNERDFPSSIWPLFIKIRLMAKRLDQFWCAWWQTLCLFKGFHSFFLIFKFRSLEAKICWSDDRCGLFAPPLYMSSVPIQWCTYLCSKDSLIFFFLIIFLVMSVILSHKKIHLSRIFVKCISFQRRSKTLSADFVAMFYCGNCFQIDKLFRQ